MFTYSEDMKTEGSLPHPAAKWKQDAWQLHQSPQLQLRMAAMAGHMRIDKIAARRRHRADGDVKRLWRRV
jgi:hypothetical protein